MANVLVAYETYEILMANPLTTDELRKAAYKVREFTTVKAMSAFGTPVKKDAAIEPEDTYQFDGSARKVAHFGSWPSMER